jgi:hypothetical protein
MALIDWPAVTPAIRFANNGKPVLTKRFSLSQIRCPRVYSLTIPLGRIVTSRRSAGIGELMARGNRDSIDGNAGVGDRGFVGPIRDSYMQEVRVI